MQHLRKPHSRNARRFAVVIAGLATVGMSMATPAAADEPEDGASEIVVPVEDPSTPDAAADSADAADGGISEAEATEPEVVEATEPDVVEAAEPEATEVIEPEVTEPGAEAEAEATETDVAEAAEPEATEPEATVAEPVTEPVTEPEATVEPEATEPVATEAEAVVAVEPVVTEPAVVEPVVTEPAVVDATMGVALDAPTIEKIVNIVRSASFRGIRW